MTLKAMYNDIASTYSIADQFGSITKSHDIALLQIKNASPGIHNPYKVLDLGIGTGVFLQKLRTFLPAADFTGLDLSPEMLKIAHESLELTTIEASATEASKYIEHHSQNLVLAHFINAYIPINTLFKQANILIKPQGHFSLITTTYDSFPVAQKILADFIATDSIISRLVGHYYKSVVKNTTVAPGKDELLQTFTEHNFEIIEHTRLNIPISLNNVEELAKFGIEGTWFLNSLAIPLIPKNFLIRRLKRMFAKIFTFPYEDTHVIDIIIAKS